MRIIGSASNDDPFLEEIKRLNWSIKKPAGQQRLVKFSVIAINLLPKIFKVNFPRVTYGEARGR